MATGLYKFVLTEDVHKQIGELLGIDLTQAVTVTIRMEPHVPVVVDLQGIRPTKPEQQPRAKLA